MKLHLWFLIRGQYNLGFINVEVISKFKKMESPRERLLRVPWTATRSNQLILKEISHEYSLEGLMLKLILQYFGYLM